MARRRDRGDGLLGERRRRAVGCLCSSGKDRRAAVLCRKCVMAMDPVDKEKSGHVSRSFFGGKGEEVEGVAEEWVCLHCGWRTVTSEHEGVRETAPYLIPLDEKEVKNGRKQIAGYGSADDRSLFGKKRRDGNGVRGSGAENILLDCPYGRNDLQHGFFDVSHRSRDGIHRLLQQPRGGRKGSKGEQQGGAGEGEERGGAGAKHEGGLEAVETGIQKERETVVNKRICSSCGGTKGESEGR